MTVRGLVVAVAVFAVVGGSGRARSEEEARIPLVITQVTLPASDTVITLVEQKKGRAVRVMSKGVVVQAVRIFLGDGKVAIEIEASADGVRMNGAFTAPGFKFHKGAVIELPADHLKAAELKAGDVYVIAPGITFEAQKK